MSDGAVTYAFEQLEASAPPPRDAAARLLAQAEVEAEEIREQARAAGHEQGRAAGHEEGRAEIELATRALGETLEAVEAERIAICEAVERDAIEFALALSEKILAGAFSMRPELVVDVVQGALRRLNDRRGIEVLLNPADLEMVRAAIGEVPAAGAGSANGLELCELIADQRIAPGAALVRTDEGEVDASVHTQLERAREVVAAELEKGEDDSPDEDGSPP